MSLGLGFRVICGSIRPCPTLIDSGRKLEAPRRLAGREHCELAEFDNLVFAWPESP